MLKGHLSRVVYRQVYSIRRSELVIWQAYFLTTGREVSSSTELDSNFTFEGIPDGPYMTDMDEVVTPSWGSQMYYIFGPFKRVLVYLNEFHVHLNDFWYTFWYL